MADRLAGAVQPKAILLLGLGLLVGFIVVSMLLAIFSINAMPF